MVMKTKNKPKSSDVGTGNNSLPTVVDTTTTPQPAPRQSLELNPWRFTTSTEHSIRVDSVARLRDFLFALDHPHSFYAALSVVERASLRDGVAAHALECGIPTLAIHASITAPLTGKEEFRLVHDVSAWGCVSFLTKGPDGQSQQRGCPLKYSSTQLSLFTESSNDTYYSQAVFKSASRCLVDLERVELAWVDLDCYNKGIYPEDCIKAIYARCNSRQLPLPTHTIFSGRGVYAKWLFDKPVKAWRMPVWKELQVALTNLFLDLGADPASIDASHVLRLVDSINTKTGAIVSVERVNHNPSMQPLRHDFDALHALFVTQPLDTPTVAKKPPQSVKPARQRPLPYLEVIDGDRQGRKLSSYRNLAWMRFCDLRTLAEMRRGARTLQNRMVFLVWSLNFMALSGQINSANFYDEARAVAQQIASDWNENDWRADELSTLYRKLCAHEKGQIVELMGKSYPVLYTPKNAHLIDLFGITEEEQARMVTIMSAKEALKRKRQRDTEWRRAAGKVERAVYLSNNADKRAKAVEMAVQGLTQKATAQELGVSRQLVAYWLKTASTPVAK